MRIAAYALAAVTPMFLAAVMLWSVVPTHTLASAGPQDPAIDREDKAPSCHPSISISIEPSGMTPYAEVEPPVVFPGYLLPDDGREETANAGS